ncbi:MAG: hypothetical protein OXH59_01405 [Rhodospirillaceae bacterium]|nr:hypothetical protein [Rhodospirillaceae bacterium]
MAQQTPPDEPNYRFAPAYGIEADVQKIRLVIEGVAGHVPTEQVALTHDDALSICDKLNRRLALDREAWVAMAAASMQAEDDNPDIGVWH